jgi:hypothetical protein
VKYAANQLVQIIKASAVSYYGERAYPAVIEVSPHHMGEFPLALSWQRTMDGGLYLVADFTLLLTLTNRKTNITNNNIS